MDTEYIVVHTPQGIPYEDNYTLVCHNTKTDSFTEIITGTQDQMELLASILNKD